MVIFYILFPLINKNQLSASQEDFSLSKEDDFAEEISV